MDHDHSNDLAVRETPSQANFIGTLALVLLVFALAVGAFGLFAAASHGWQ
jgi:hypothetical protein